MEHLDKYIIYW